MQSHAYKLARGYWLVAVLVLLFGGSKAQAQEIEGTWRLVMRKLPDGTIQKPPEAQGAATWHSGLRDLVLFGRTAEGKPWSASLISRYKLSPTEYTETLLESVVDDGSGKLPVYEFSKETKAVPITRDGQRIAFKPPFEPVSFGFEANKFTATMERDFVDYWERVH